MTDTLTARPQLLKQANLSRIRGVLKGRETATRAEIAEETGISSTTVRSLLAEMMQNGEIESAGYDESSGGRKAERYAFRADRYYGAAICINDYQMHGLLVNSCGEILETVELPAKEEEFEPVIFSFLDGLTAQKEIKAIGIGVPGVVEGGSFWRKSGPGGELCRIKIGDRLAQRYGVPVIVENDLKAMAIGCVRCYQKEFPCENPEDTNMAYLHFEKGCISAGFIAGGRVIRGSNNFAGELGLIPMEDDRLLDERLEEPMEDAGYTDFITKILCWICGILNPQFIVLGGPSLRKDCIGAIGEELSALLPKRMYAELYYSSDVWHDYHEGMAYLAAGKMFEEIQFVKEQVCRV